ncbi:MAG: DNA-directed RNA polymerase subunit alpha [Thermanaerothrix sp.]|uniref:DNA-directed RNA polymerase subunit alpha n=1 Tax=Thermanaerothrix solaris TaxID=3058434 RepID=A0ABU3NLL7_9CHLR|nr:MULTISPECIES: DNA-directed RNA polymerase subunit alpha [unclassified Thermanaerothrix]MDT8897702.1 DNA-directed RNA polymerase subunit alpha [Thermanaerothrix sp. 4228-RoL]
MSAVSSMVKPRIEQDAQARNYGRFVISPLERGYGVTLGNALRRVLLSSLEGAAVTSIRITDVLHEFSDIPGVREDVIQVMLQIKQLRLILHDVDTATLQLEVRGEGPVTAADIQTPAEVEIVNPELYLFTVDDPNTRLDIEMVVERGRGYSPASDRSGRLPIGDLPVDAIFSPVKRVNYNVEATRVGQSTNYERLTLEIWTDGTISPEKALVEASRILIDHFRLVAGVGEEAMALAAEKEPSGIRLSSEAADTPIENLDLSVRVFNSLKRTGITTVGDVLELLEKGNDAVMSIRNFGEKSLEELRQKMREKGFLPPETKEAE